MPTNKKGGKNFKKAKKNSFQAPTFDTAKDGQLYAKIKKKLGDRRFSLILHGTGEETIGRARGSLKGWHNMKANDIVLVSTRDFRNTEGETFVQDCYDIIQYYLPDHIRKLIKMGDLTDSTFVECGESNFEYYDDDDEEDSDEIAPQKNYDMPDSESDSDEDPDIDNL